MANTRPTLYAGVTSNLKQRIYQHKHGLVDGFTKQYKIHMLVYYEVLDTINAAIIREKQIKDMSREEKLKMIDTFNPEFKDLYEMIQ